MKTLEEEVAELMGYSWPCTPEQLLLIRQCIAEGEERHKNPPAYVIDFTFDETVVAPPGVWKDSRYATNAVGMLPRPEGTLTVTELSDQPRWTFRPLRRHFYLTTNEMPTPDVVVGDETP